MISLVEGCRMGFGGVVLVLLLFASPGVGMRWQVKVIQWRAVLRCLVG